MVANIRGYTPNYSFKLVNFDTPRWHTLEYANWNQLDAILLQAGIAQVRGEWLYNTTYLIGDRVFDGVTNDLYRCLIQHISASSGTFEQDRIAHPSYWALQLPGVPLFRGEWTPNSTYTLGDIVFTDDFTYRLCSDAHTSSATFPPDVAYWQIVFDASSAVGAAEGFAFNASVSAGAASSSAASASLSATNALNSSIASANSATASETSADEADISEANALSSANASAASAAGAASSALDAAGSALTAANQAATLRGTSVTPNEVTLGVKIFETQTGKQFDAGTYLTIVSADNTTIAMTGMSTGYSSGTLQINISNITGAGIFSSWNIYVSGADGLDGVNGQPGQPGIDGDPGLFWRGNWNSTTQYNLRDGVAHLGASYICAVPNINSPPPSVSWGLLAQAGSSVLVDDQVLPQNLDADTAPKQILFRDRLNLVSRTGDTMTGLLSLPSTPPPVATSAVRKDYVDGLISGVDLSSKVSKAGDTMTGPLSMPQGSTVTTSINFGGVNSGFYSIGTTNIAAAVSGVNRMIISGSSFTTNVPLRLAPGTAAIPSYSFTAETNSGLYRPTAGQLSTTVGGVESMRWSSIDNSTLALGPLMVSAAPTADLQVANKKYITDTAVVKNDVATQAMIGNLAINTTGSAGARVELTAAGQGTWHVANSNGDHGPVGELAFWNSAAGVSSMMRLRPSDKAIIGAGHIAGAGSFFTGYQTPSGSVRFGTVGVLDYNTTYANQFSANRQLRIDANDPQLHNVAPAGGHARTFYTVTGLRTYGIGVLNDGNFSLTDETAGAFRFTMNSSGTGSFNSTLNFVGGTSSGDLTVNRNVLGSPHTGLIFWGNTGTKYTYWDGAAYNFIGGVINLGVEGYAGSHAVSKNYVDNKVGGAGFLPLSGGTLNGKLLTADGVWTTMGYGGSAGGLEIGGPGGDADAIISFHRHGTFGVNFGLANSNHMQYGGWSHGGSVFTLWSTAYFGYPTQTCRLAYAGDSFRPEGDLGEPYDGACVTTSCYSFYSPSGQAGNTCRYRYLQVLTNAWYTVGYA